MDSLRGASRIKILHIHTRGIIGGSGTNTLLSMIKLPKDRFDPMLACGSEGPLVDEAIKNDLKVFILPHLRNDINIFRDFFLRCFRFCLCLLCHKSPSKF